MNGAKETQITPMTSRPTTEHKDVMWTPKNPVLDESVSASSTAHTIPVSSTLFRQRKSSLARLFSMGSRKSNDSGGSSSQRRSSFLSSRSTATPCQWWTARVVLAMPNFVMFLIMLFFFGPVERTSNSMNNIVSVVSYASLVVFVYARALTVSYGGPQLKWGCVEWLEFLVVYGT